MPSIISSTRHIVRVGVELNSMNARPMKAGALSFRVGQWWLYRLRRKIKRKTRQHNPECARATMQPSSSSNRQFVRHQTVTLIDNRKRILVKKQCKHKTIPTKASHHKMCTPPALQCFFFVFFIQMVSSSLCSSFCWMVYFCCYFYAFAPTLNTLIAMINADAQYFMQNFQCVFVLTSPLSTFMICVRL